MEITLNKTDETKARLSVKLQEADYAPKVDEKIKEYSKKAQVKGFRPGKVPPGMIRKLYGKGILVDQINQLLHESVNNYIKTENLRILGEPLPERANENAIDWDNQKEFEFSYELGLLPEFELPLDRISVDAYSVEVDDKTVAETYEQMQKQFGQSTNPEVSEQDDFLYGELKQGEGDFTTKTLIPINKVVEGQDKFIGVKPEDEIRFDLRQAFGDDANLAHVTGLAKDLVQNLKGEFTFKVEKINRTSPAELDQEFFDKVLGKDAVTSQEEFDAKVREIISENYNREAEKVLNFQLIDKLVKETNVELPEDFFRKWLLATNEGKLTAEQIDQNFAQYTRELKWSMIRNKVTEEQGLKVTEEEVVQRTKQKLMAQFNLPPQMEEEMDELLSNYADNHLKQNNGRNFVNEYEEILAQKVLENIKGRISVNEKKVTAEEFRNLSFE